jgi:hypothetical protein
MVEALKSEPNWTPVMYCVFNDLTDEMTTELIELWNESNHGIKEKEANAKSK